MWTIRGLPAGVTLVRPKGGDLLRSKLHLRATGSIMATWFCACVLAGWPATRPAAAEMDREPAGAIQTERISDPDYWHRMGYIEMVPSLRLPTTHDATDMIQVYLRVPPGRSISALDLESQGRYTLLFPPGTRADRVESIRYRKGKGVFGETPTDVRGTLLLAGGGQRFHTLRPVSGKPSAPLLGWSWPAHDKAAREEATRRIMDLAARVGTPVGRPPLSGDELRALQSLNHCAECHVANHRRAASIDGAPLPRRETDASGFYVPLSVLHREVAVAATRPLDLNASDPYVDVRCGVDPARLVRDGDWIWYRCADGSVPIGRRDVRAALAAGDDYTAAVCRSRRYLYDHMDPAAREAFAVSFQECGIRFYNTEHGPGTGAARR